MTQTDNDALADMIEARILHVADDAVDVALDVNDWQVILAALRSPAPMVDGEKLGRFGHHPEADIDYDCEIEALIGMAYDRLTGMREQPDIEERIRKAMEFRVMETPLELRWLSQKFNGTREIYTKMPDCIARLEATRPQPAQDERRVPTSKEVMLAGGIDPDAPFEVGPFPKEMRHTSFHPALDVGYPQADIDLLNLIGEVYVEPVTQDAAAICLDAIRAYREAAQHSGESALRAIARKWLNWLERADDPDDDCDYLNEDGWDDVRALAVETRAALGGGGE